ncbi:germination protein YpeB [Serpentinicella sp. ANB-PHB4]|uniref:germination protein YpeB n=1 Tax=Serpentinicella sp. ANB-PHB4 TaxID=3074076 RepID=UPI00285A733D|nr:germination protein YpeB [Serpentinicella sp. ANB-PHB4]MDR5659415.1 germination protein YpeB [Serpentinicella sp. ANB-PHB4]
MEKWKRYTLPVILGIALIGTSIWGVYQYNQSRDYHTYLDLQFQRQFYDLIGHVENAQVDLAKAMVSGSTNDMAKFLNETVFQSYMAQEKLTQLPLNHANIRQVEKFLSQMGDYCTAMVNKTLEGQLLDEEEMETLTELHSYANLLSQHLIELQQQIVADGVNFGDLRREANRDLDAVNDRMTDMNLINIEERMQDYPELIYDGPFSEHMKDRKPRLEGEEIQRDEAIGVLQEAFSDQNISNIEAVGGIQNTAFTGYYLRAQKEGNGDGEEVAAGITKQGGHILWYINPRVVGDSQLDENEAIDIAEQFLQTLGYDDMVSTYTIAYEGQILINFAYMQDDVIVYPDLIKVKVALDNGDILGLETEGYLMNHHEREIAEPEISEDEAREKLTSAAEVENVRLAMIPTEGQDEVLCYEFTVQLGEDRYLIYIHAETGHQRQILLMVEQEDGTLVI